MRARPGAFLRWCEDRGVSELRQLKPIHVAVYVDQLQGERSAPTVKQHLACLRFATIPGTTPLYDGNGNLTNDGFHTYGWDAEGNLISVDGVSGTFDALGRRAELGSTISYDQMLYAPFAPNHPIGLGSALSPAGIRIPIPGGGETIFRSTGLTEYRHPNWQGSQVLLSFPTQTTPTYGGAFTPFGEKYATYSGGFNGYFAGMLGIADEGAIADAYQAEARLMHQAQGRWISPDPAGMGAVDLTNPQTLNRYAYVANDPLNKIDPAGTCDEPCYKSDVICGVACFPGWSVIPPIYWSYFLAQFGPTNQPSGSGTNNTNGGGGPSGSSTTKPPMTGQTASKIGWCLVKGAAVGAAGALVVGAAVVVAAPALGVSAATASTALFVAGAVGGAATVYSAVRNYQNGNYSAAGFDLGSFGGGIAAGGLVGGKVGDGINTPATRGFWSLSRDIKNVFNPSEGWDLGKFMATGPDAAAAAGATGAAGSSGSLLSRVLGCG